MSTIALTTDLPVAEDYESPSGLRYARPLHELSHDLIEQEVPLQKDSSAGTYALEEAEPHRPPVVLAKRKRG
jgi:hypothetical protein